MSAIELLFTDEPDATLPELTVCRSEDLQAMLSEEKILTHAQIEEIRQERIANAGGSLEAMVNSLISGKNLSAKEGCVRRSRWYDTKRLDWREYASSQQV